MGDKLWREFKERGDKESFHTLFCSNYTHFCHYAACYLSDSLDCEEVVLDYFLHLWTHRTQIEIETSFAAYSSRAIKNRCLNKLRRSRHTLNLDGFDNIGDIGIDMFSEEDINRVVWEAVEELPAKCRAVFTKSRVEHLSNAEIAADMNLSEKTVEGHITRAIKAVRIAMKKYYFVLMFMHL